MAGEQQQQQQTVKGKSRARVIGPMAAILVVLAYLMGRGFGGFGFGTGNGTGSSDDRSGSPNSTMESQEEANTQEEQESVEVVTAPAGITYFTIEVREAEIYVNDALVTLDQLQSLITTAEEGSQFVIKDNHAIKGTYDSVRELLQRQGVKFLEG